MRKVTLSEFKGKTMVNIREYYEKDGKELPGKKVCKGYELTGRTLLTHYPGYKHDC